MMRLAYVLLLLGWGTWRSNVPWNSAWHFLPSACFLLSILAGLGATAEEADGRSTGIVCSVLGFFSMMAYAMVYVFFTFGMI